MKATEQYFPLFCFTRWFCFFSFVSEDQKFSCVAIGMEANERFFRRCCSFVFKIIFSEKKKMNSVIFFAVWLSAF